MNLNLKKTLTTIISFVVIVLAIIGITFVVQQKILGKGNKQSVNDERNTLAGGPLSYYSFDWVYDSSNPSGPTVKVFYNSNGGTINSSVYEQDDNGWVKRILSGVSNEPDSFPLPNYDDLGILRTGYNAVSGKEWCTKADGTGTCFNISNVYNYSDYKNAATTDNGNYVLYLYVNWKKLETNTSDLRIFYHANGGTPTSSGFGVNSSGYITQNGNRVMTTDSIWKDKNFVIKKDGYIIKTGSEWCTKANGTGYCFNLTDSYTIQQLKSAAILDSGIYELVLYQNWVQEQKPIRIYYNANGGTLNSSTYSQNSNGWITNKSTGQLYYSDTLEEYYQFDIEREGYVIDIDEYMYCTQANGGGHCMDPEYGHTYEQLKAMSVDAGDYYKLEVYLHWVEGTKPIRIYYNTNGGTVSSTTYGKNSEDWITRKNSNEAIYTANYNLWDLSTFGVTRSGYSAVSGKEWCTQPNGGGTCFNQNTDYTFDQLFAGASDENPSYVLIEVYANWKSSGGSSGGSTSYTIKYDANGGTGAPGNGTKTAGTTYKISSTKPTRIGYYFIEWNTNKNGTGTSYSPGASYTKDEGVTLYAIWGAKKVTIIFNKNDGSGTKSQKTYTYDGNMNDDKLQPASGMNTRAGYSFAGWSFKADGSDNQKRSYNDPVGETWFLSQVANTNEATVNMYAQWTEKSIMVTFLAEGATEASKTAYVKYGSPYGKLDNSTKIELPVPVKAGYDFVGWYKDTTYQVKVEATDKVVETSNFTLYAKFVLSGDDDTYVDHGGYITYGEYIIFPEGTKTNALPIESTYNGVYKPSTIKVVRTGDTLTLKNKTTNEIVKVYEVVVLGDINGDGFVKSSDYLLIKEHAMDEIVLEGAYKVAANVNKDKKVNSADYLTLKEYIMAK